MEIFIYLIKIAKLYFNNNLKRNFLYAACDKIQSVKSDLYINNLCNLKFLIIEITRCSCRVVSQKIWP